MEIIIEVLTKAMDSNIAYAVLMDIVVAFLFLFNIILGTILGTKEDRFDVKKFFFGVLKAIVILLVVIGLCYILNVFTLVLNLIEGVAINEELVSTLEMLTILISVALDIAKECLEKVRSIRELKYVSYDNIVVSDTNVIEPTELKG